jgi:hypothetical protein
MEAREPRSTRGRDGRKARDGGKADGAGNGRGVGRDIAVGVVGAVVGAVAAVFAQFAVTTLLDPEKAEIVPADLTVATQSVVVEGLEPALPDDEGVEPPLPDDEDEGVEPPLPNGEGVEPALPDDDGLEPALPDEGGKGQPASVIENRPMVTMTVHNQGERRSVVTEIRLTVEASSTLRDCAGATGGRISTTARYGVQLPLRPSPGQVIIQPVGHEIGTDAVDKFSVVFEPPGDAVLDLHLYRLKVTLVHDQGRSTDLGRVLIAAPADPSGIWFTKYGDIPFDALRTRALAETGCYRQNIRTAAAFLRAPGARTPALQRITEALPPR